MISKNYEDSIYTDPDEVTHRLQKASNIKEQLRIKAMHEELYDKETGQPLFYPKTGRPPLGKRDNVIQQ